MQKWIAFWLASLVAAAVSASTLTYAQAGQAESGILSGENIGFRLTGKDDSGRPTGTLMVRLDGKWIEAGFAPTVRQASASK